MANMTNTQGTPGASPVNHSTLWAAVAVLVTVLVAGVTLSLAGMDAGAIAGLLTTLVGLGAVLVATLDKATSVQRVNAEQDRKLDIIEERTNGGLHQTIKAVIDESLADRFGPPPGGAE